MLSDVENQTDGAARERRSVSPRSDEKEEGGGSNQASVRNEEPKGFFRGRFESPNWMGLAKHSVICALIYPFLFGLTKAADGQTLFVVRLIVALGCTVIGLAVAYTLHDFVKRFMEAVTWRTILEQNDPNEKRGDRDRRMTLAELSGITADPLSMLSAVKLFFIRLRIWGGAHSSQKFFYIIVLFIVVVTSVAGGLAFALGRIVDITTAWTFETHVYEEAPMFGDLFNDTDPEGTFINFNRTLHGQYLEEVLRDPAPPAWRFDATASTKKQVGNETVYFTTPYAAQLRANGSAYGGVIGAANLGVQHQDVDVGSGDDSPTAKLLQFPQWGTTVSCDRLPDLASNIVHASESAEVVIPSDFVANLYGKVGLGSPEVAIRSLQPDYLPVGSLNEYFYPTAVAGNDSTPNVATTITFRWASRFNLTLPGPGTEEGRFAAGWITDTGSNGGGWTIFDILLIRCYADFVNGPTQCANFPVSAPDIPGGPPVGYDAIACVQRTDPYIIGVRNSTRSVTLTDVIGRGSSLESVVAGNFRRRNEALDENFGRNLSSGTKGGQYYLMNVFSTWLWLSRAGNMGLLSEQDNSWLDPATGQISISLFEDFRGVTAATSVLALMAGPKQLVARQFKSRQVAFARILNIPMAIAIVLLFLAGVIGSFCIPRLPNGFPRRRFDIYSWMMAIEGDKMTVEGEGSSKKWDARMNVEEVEKEFGSMRVAHPVPV